MPILSIIVAPFVLLIDQLQFFLKKKVNVLSIHFLTEVAQTLSNSGYYYPLQQLAKRKINNNALDHTASKRARLGTIPMSVKPQVSSHCIILTPYKTYNNSMPRPMISYCLHFDLSLWCACYRAWLTALHTKQ